MISSQKKKQLLGMAERFAAELAGCNVSRSEWRHVADALYLGPGTPQQRLARAKKLIDALPDSWVKTRGKQTPRQLRQVRGTFQSLLAKRLPDEEQRYVVGWTTRLLHLRSLEQRRASPPVKPV